MPDSRRLAQRLAEGRLGVPEALRVSAAMADELRRMQEDGRVHGALGPEHIQLTESGVELYPGPVSTAYAAPEVLAGREADTRSDIFSFGAIVFELFTGQRAFEGVERDGARSTGSPAVDRVVVPCLALQPELRPARIRNVILQLNVLKVAARRAAAGAAAKSRETRLAARLEAQERAIGEMQRSVGEAVAILRAQVSMVRERAGTADSGERLNDRVGAIEQTLEAMKRHTLEFEQSVAADLVDIEKGMNAQKAAVDAARLSLSQTEQVVESLVKALEALQRAVLDRDESGDSTLVVN